jgi:hypothetical protein
MGSGGLRGLQIPWSGASGVRGGFDSHAFPPHLRPALALALALTLCLAGRAAAAALPDSLPQLQGIEVVNSDKVAAAKRAHADSVKARGWSAQPRFVMARSLLIPGWGQAYNGAWFKSGAVAAGEVTLGAAIYNDSKKLDDLQQQLEQARLDGDQQRESELVNEYNDQLDRRIAHSWFLAAVVAYALVDAYVDANFRGFELEFKHDPALPNGLPPATPGGGGGTTRLGLRWHF